MTEARRSEAKCGFNLGIEAGGMSSNQEVTQLEDFGHVSVVGHLRHLMDFKELSALAAKVRDSVLVQQRSINDVMPVVSTFYAQEPAEC